jgi:hypothetical protein
LVDSDGEEGNDTETGECVGLKENDLVNLINQIPLEQLFRFDCLTFTCSEQSFKNYFSDS